MVGRKDGYFGVYAQGTSVDRSGEETGEGVRVLMLKGCTCAGMASPPCAARSRDRCLSHPPLRETNLQHSD